MGVARTTEPSGDPCGWAATVDLDMKQQKSQEIPALVSQLLENLSSRPAWIISKSLFCFGFLF